MEILLKGKQLQNLMAVMNEMPYKFAKPLEMILADAEQEMLSKNKETKKENKVVNIKKDGN